MKDCYAPKPGQNKAYAASKRCQGIFRAGKKSADGELAWKASDSYCCCWMMRIGSSSGCPLFLAGGSVEESWQPGEVEGLGRCRC